MTQAEKPKKVLFVCTANICRSPMAEAVFSALVSDAGMPYEARSAGVAALVGEPMAPNAVAVLEEVGVYPGKHRARQVDEPMLQEADLVLAMTSKHVTALRRLPAGSSEKVRTLLGYTYDAPDLEGVSDPYGQSIVAYRASLRRIYETVEVLMARLKDQKGVP
jgi:protein-tyrosine phosphatase